MRLLTLLVLVGSLFACSNDEPTIKPIIIPPILEDVVDTPEETINFGLYASGKPIDLIRDFSPIIESLEVHASTVLEREIDIQIKISKTYEEGIDVLVNGDVDFARFGPASYVEAVEKDGDIDLLAMESINDQTEFYGIIAIHKNSPLTSVEELSGYSFAFGDEKSTIGRYLSQQFLADNNVKAKDLSRFEYLGRHDRVGEAVGTRTFVAGALNEKTFDRLVERGVPIKELARFKNVTKPWISNSSMDDELEAALREGLLLLTEGDGLTSLQVTNMVEGSDSDYATIRESILNNSEFFEEYTNTE